MALINNIICFKRIINYLKLIIHNLISKTNGINIYSFFAFSNFLK